LDYSRFTPSGEEGSKSDFFMDSLIMELLHLVEYAILTLPQHLIERRTDPLSQSIPPIVVYLIERHPLDMPETGPLFKWIQTEDGFKRELTALIGPYDPEDLTVLIDKEPAGIEWKKLLEALLTEQIQMVVTHLAPLSSAQRQQLIGLCDQMGAQLITPGDAGRNRKEDIQST
jgi:hypothetical protein